MDGGFPLTPKRLEFDLPGRGPGRLSALEFGPGDRPYDLIFLHANGFNAGTYRRILEPLAQTRRILAIDQRGHGASTLTTTPEGRTDWSDFRDDLLALLEVLEAKDVVLSGHSMGGTTSLLAAAATPTRVRALVLFDPVILPGPPGSIEARGAGHSPMVQAALRRRAVFPSRKAALDAYRGRGAFRTWPEEILADFVESGFVDLPGGDVRLACEPAWEASSYASHGHDPWLAFEVSTCPIDILRAEEASTCSVDGHLAELTHSGRVHVETIARSTHFLPMERLDVVQRALTKALV